MDIKEAKLTKAIAGKVIVDFCSEYLRRLEFLRLKSSLISISRCTAEECLRLLEPDLLRTIDNSIFLPIVRFRFIGPYFPPSIVYRIFIIPRIKLSNVQSFDELCLENSLSDLIQYSVTSWKLLYDPIKVTRSIVSNVENYDPEYEELLFWSETLDFPDDISNFDNDEFN
eukprot:TRINITY_DN791_c0_g1_i1.p1 TRINITY_DN791_c0_g1~~TRINITY_DN791_c0_g1_i1.p1  ORF type:complete len:170 (-),score=32.55 TRINITY_DN791_c0_g1_i1:306-815(-)